MQRLVEVGGRHRLALEPGHDPVADPGDGGLDLTEELARPDELLPPREDLATQEGTVAHPGLDTGGGRRIRRQGRLLEGLSRTDLGRRRVDQRLDAGVERVERAGQRLADHESAGTRVLGQRREPRVQPGHLVVRQQAVVLERRLRHREDRSGAEALLLEHRPEVLSDDGDRALGDPVEHDGHRGPAFRRLAEQLPGHRIRIPGRRRDEEPQIRRTEQLAGQLTVPEDDGVDVGGVEEGEPRRQGRGGDQLHGRLALDRVAAGGPREVREDPRRGEPALVVGVVHEDRRPRGRAEHARSADHRPHQGVDQRRLARTGRSSDHGQEGRVEGREARQDVVVELPQQLGTAPLGRADPGEVEGQAGRPDLVAQRRHSRQEVLRLRRGGQGHARILSCGALASKWATRRVITRHHATSHASVARWPPAGFSLTSGFVVPPSALSLRSRRLFTSAVGTPDALRASWRAPGRTRTCNLRIRRPLHYPLCYEGRWRVDRAA